MGAIKLGDGGECFLRFNAEHLVKGNTCVSYLGEYKKPNQPKTLLANLHPESFVEWRD